MIVVVYDRDQSAIQRNSSALVGSSPLANVLDGTIMMAPFQMAEINAYYRLAILHRSSYREGGEGKGEIPRWKKTRFLSLRDYAVT